MNSKAIRQWFDNRTPDMGVDKELFERSRLARTSRRLIQASVVIHALVPVVTIVCMLVFCAEPALAQTPGGSIFNGNDQTLGNGVREAIKYGRNLLFLLGVAGIMWAAVNYMFEKNWFKQLIGGIACMGFGAIAAIAYSFSQGQAVNLDTNLGQ